MRSVIFIFSSDMDSNQCQEHGPEEKSRDPSSYNQPFKQLHFHPAPRSGPLCVVEGKIHEIDLLFQREAVHHIWSEETCLNIDLTPSQSCIKNRKCSFFSC